MKWNGVILVSITLILGTFVFKMTAREMQTALLAIALMKLYDIDDKLKKDEK